MIISDEQVRRALEHLQTTTGGTQDPNGGGERLEVTDDLVRRIQSALADEPDVRADRIAHAREGLRDSRVSGKDVAEKIIGRAISDSLR